VKQIRKRLTYANVMSSIAVFMVLGGATAFAATKIGPNEIKANSIKTGKIVKEAVTAGKIKNAAITSTKLGAGAVTEGALADNAVTANKIADNAVTANKIAANAVTASKLANASVTAEKLAPGTVASSVLSQPVPGLALAGAKVVGGEVVSSFNRFGGAPTIQEVEPGERTLTFPGLQLDDNKVIHQATLRGPANGLISADAEGGSAVVITWNIQTNGDNTQANRGFNYVVYGTP
jgi:hypothetical protein